MIRRNSIFEKTSCCMKERVASIFRGLLSKFSSNVYQTTRCYISHKLRSVSCINYHSLGKNDKKKFVYKFVQSPSSRVDVKNQRICTLTPPCGFTAGTGTNLLCTVTDLARDSSFGTAIRYKVQGPGIEPRWTRDFLHPSRPAFLAHPASHTTGTGSFPGVQRSGRGLNHPPTASAEGNETVDL